MPPRFIAALDQGTTSTRCILFDHAVRHVASAQREHHQIYPRPGWVEHDPLEIWQSGTLTLPLELREKYGFRTGDTLHLVDLDGILVLTPMAPLVPELAREIKQARLEAGLSTEEFLHSLREERERYFREKYASGATG